MTFNSYTFVLFMLLVVAVRYSGVSWRARKGFLLVMSYLFYAAWNPPFLLLIWLSTGVDWVCARRMHGEERIRVRKVWLGVSLGVNLGLLAWFKYAGFFVLNTSRVLGWIGLEWNPILPDILLPVGISFYTFQTLSYSIDVYRRRLEPADSFLDYALYVTFFPQLVAGPIVRAKGFLAQCKTPRPFREDRFGYGMFLILLGLFEKIVLADAFFAPVVEAAYAQHQGVGFADAWIGTIAFAGQIFCDFAGYSTCAIGAAGCLGFDLPMNFRFPYAARGFSDFWKRWHISLSEWLRDYLYIPLGGNRSGSWFTMRNLFLTMLLGGLWHGAGWTFIAWGLLHGFFLVGEHLVRGWLGDRPERYSGRWMGLGIQALTFLLVCVTWVFFRAEEWGQAMVFLQGMSGLAGWAPGGGGVTSGDAILTLLLIGGLLVAHHRLRDCEFSEVIEGWSLPTRSLVMAGMMVVIALSPVPNNAFIYFQF